jgi:hypothetical protein
VDVAIPNLPTPETITSLKVFEPIPYRPISNSPILNHSASRRLCGEPVVRSHCQAQAVGMGAHLLQREVGVGRIALGPPGGKGFAVAGQTQACKAADSAPP